MEKTKIRPAETRDREELVKMRLQMQRHMEASNPGIWRITEEGMLQTGPDVDGTLSDEDGRVLVAEEDGMVIGFAHGHVARRNAYTPRVVGHINTIYIKEPQRRRGIGSRLVRELCLFFRAEGVEEVNLRYVLGNKEAEGFWRSLGFNPVIQTANTPLDALERRLKIRPEQSKPFKKTF